MKARQILTVAGTSALLISAYVIAPGGTAVAATCVPATNIEAIIDDSGSMLGSDPNTNRAEALKILIGKSGNARKTLGAIEFGSASTFSTPPLPGATTVFAPQGVSAGAAAMRAALDANIKADHGTTDYNAAFALAKTDNPNATARIFLTDGGHNVGAYANGHQGGPRTYVVGMGIGANGTSTDATRLQTIANETGGRYFPNVTNANVNATMNQVDAALNCQKIGKTFTDLFKKNGQAKRKSLRVSSKSRSLDFVLSWQNPLDKFTISKLSLRLSNGDRKRLKIKRSAGKTFVNVHVTGLRRGSLRFQLKAVNVTNTLTGVSLTTQATQSRSR